MKGARIGVARDFMGKDAGVDAVMEQSIAKLQQLGAEFVDVDYPDYLIDSKQGIYKLLVSSEFNEQVTDYLQTTKPGLPKSFDEVVARSNDPATRYRSPEKAYSLEYTAALARSLDDPQYLAVKNQALAATTAGIDAISRSMRSMRSSIRPRRVPRR